MIATVHDCIFNITNTFGNAYGIYMQSISLPTNTLTVYNNNFSMSILPNSYNIYVNGQDAQIFVGGGIDSSRISTSVSVPIVYDNATYNSLTATTIYAAADHLTNSNSALPVNTNSIVSAAQAALIASQFAGGTTTTSLSTATPVLVLESQGGDIGQAINAQFAAGMQRKGYIKIIGYENIEGPNLPYGTPSLDSILNYMGVSPEIGSSTNIALNYAVAYTNNNQYISRYQNNGSYPNMTISMRKLLAQQQTNSVVLYIAGPSAALSDFLNSPADQYYNGTGTQEISNYCAYAVIMAGGYPNNLAEFNLTTSPSTDNSYSSPLWPTNVPQYWVDYQAGTNVVLMTTNFSQYLEAQSPLTTYMTQNGNAPQIGRWSWDSMAFLATMPQFMTNFYGIQLGHLDIGLTNNINNVGSNWWTAAPSWTFQYHISYTNFNALSNILNLMCLVPPDASAADHVMFSSGITNQNLWPKTYQMMPEYNQAAGVWVTNLIHEEFETGCQPWNNIYGYWTNDFNGYPQNFNSQAGIVDWNQTGTNSIFGNSSAEFSGTAGIVYAGFDFSNINVTNMYVHIKLKMSAIGFGGGQISAFQLCAQPFILANSGQAANVNIQTDGGIKLFNGSTTSESVGLMTSNVVYDIWMFYSTTATCWAAFSTDGSIPTSGNNYVSEAANHTLGVSGFNLTSPFNANFWIDNVIVSTNPIPIQYPGNQYPYLKLINPLTINVPWTNIYPIRLDFTVQVQVTNSATLINSDIYATNYTSKLALTLNPDEALISTNSQTLSFLPCYPGEVICVTNVANGALLSSWGVQH